jgi:hypothetical protein
VANPKWPSSVPGPVLESIDYRPAFDNVIRSQMDIGLKARRRATSVPMLVNFRLALSSAQLQVLRGFYEITLQCVLPFEWIDFRNPDRDPVIYTFADYPKHQAWGETGGWMVDVSLIQHTQVFGHYPLDVSPLGT